MNKEEKIILTVTGINHMLVHAVMLVLPAILLVLQKEFNVGLATLGIIATLSQLMFGLGALPAGIIENKVGGRRLLLVYQFGVAASIIIIVTAKSLFTLTGGLMLMGLFSSIYHPAGLTIISNRVRTLSKGMAFHGVMGSIGLAVGPLIGAFLTSLWNWQLPYIVLGIILLLLGISTIILVPKSSNSENEENNTKVTQTNKKALSIYYGIIIFIGLAFAGFTTYLPTHFAINTRGVLGNLSDTVRGGLFTTLVLLSGMIGQLLGGFLGDKHNKPKLLFIVIILNIPLLILIGYSTGLWLIIFGILLGITHFIWQPVGNALIAQITHSKHRGLSYGINFFLSFGVGSFAASVGGIVAENLSVNMVFPIMAVFLIPGFLLVVPLIKIIGRSKS